MKTVNTIFIPLIILFLYGLPLIGQDSLDIDQLSKLSYFFQITDGQLSGEGATFLNKEIDKSQYTILGEYHDSYHISKLTDALIPRFHESGYRHMVLEVGPNTGRFLNKLSKDKGQLVQQLKKVNQKYNLENENDPPLPIPFFGSTEDAEFLGRAKSLGWNIFGIDQEFYSSYVLQNDWMYQNMNKAEKKKMEAKYYAANDTINRMYKDKKPFYSILLNSTWIMEYFQQMSQVPMNKEIVDGLIESAKIYDLNRQRKWYESNATRIKLMKHNLRAGIEESNFDISKDKLLLKIGGYHASLGFSPLALYEVGNTLNELAEYYGNTALNIGFMNRYDASEGKIEDALDDDNIWIQNHKHFISMGREKEWVIIDLRPIRPGYYFHPQRYELNEWEEKIIQRFDLLIITPTEYQTTNNY